MKRHTHLTCEQRYLISNSLKEGYSQKAIANMIGVNKSTISREICRNGTSRGRVGRRTARAGAYRPAGAHKQAMARRVGKSRARTVMPCQVNTARNILGSWHEKHHVQKL